MTIEKQIIIWKNDLNSIAEIGWHEVRTTAFIKKCIGKPSIIEGLRDNKVGAAFALGSGTEKIFLRADIDGLPVQNGVKHICGHSSHIAGLLGAYHYLKSKESELNQKNKQVLFIFQPAEETFPSGAKAFVDIYPELFRDSRYGFGVHNNPSIPVGSVELKSGVRSAAGDYVEIEVIGKSIHIESTPHGIDAIYGASLIVQAVRDFQKIFPHFGDTLVFNLNTVQGGTAPNIVAGNVKMTGDVRWFEEKDKKKVKEFLTKLPALINPLFGGKVLVTYYDAYPPVINNPLLTKTITAMLKKKSNFSVVKSSSKNLGIEDFCYYTDIAPCLFTNVGVGGNHFPHTEEYTVSDSGTLAIFDYWKFIIDWWLQ